MRLHTQLIDTCSKLQCTINNKQKQQTANGTKPGSCFARSVGDNDRKCDMLAVIGVEEF